MADGPHDPTEGPTGTGWHPSSTPPPGELKQSGTATLVGEVRSMQQRTEHMGRDSSRTIWTFRLERYDANGNRLRPVPVEMRGLAFEGSLSDGDQVRVAGRWRDGTLRADRLENLTTGALVRAKSYKGLMIAAGIVFLIIVALVAWFAIDASNDFNRNSEQFEQQFEDGQEQFERDSEQAEQEALERFCENAAQAGLSPPQCSG